MAEESDFPLEIGTIFEEYEPATGEYEEIFWRFMVLDTYPGTSPHLKMSLGNKTVYKVLILIGAFGMELTIMDPYIMPSPEKIRIVSVPDRAGESP